MKVKKSKLKFLATLTAVTTVFALFFTSCSDGDGVSAESEGQATVGVTDAAVDAQNITGVYLAIDEVQAKSNTEIKTIARFDAPKEFNVMAYQNGEVYALADGSLATGTYDEIRLILSSEAESSYVKFKDGTKTALDVPSGSTSGYKIKGDFDIAANAMSNLVVDIDLRKALVVTGNNTYMLRPTARTIDLRTTGIIKGSVQKDAFDRTVVYAYAKGTFNDAEGDAPAEGQSRFENSVNSAVVAEDGTFTLAFMQEGDYEIVVSRYEMNEEKEEYEFKSVVSSNIWLNGSIANVVSVESNATVDLSIDLGL
ncbi:MAG: DUF4382 domain-containing protein [Cyclobacteriaceae bacterium]